MAKYYYIAESKKPKNFFWRVISAIKVTFSLDIIKGLSLSLREFCSKSVTVQYPLESMPLSSRYRSIHKLQRLLESNNERCIGCGLCEKICTSNCIRIITGIGSDGRKKIDDYTINFGRCIYCGLCAEVCPELAIVHGERIENASTQRAHFGAKDFLLEKAPSGEFQGYGSVSVNADSLLIPTPLVYGIKQKVDESQENNISQGNTAPQEQNTPDSHSTTQPQANTEANQ